ncbi:MAG: hypothetical protein KAS48_08815 [Gammaproteobacteria bacterium]|nr:hypothetical protein [Gammaproteobacteria bacterium]
MTRIILISLCLAVTSCVTVAPVVNPDSEISIYGVSSLPPQNGSWTLLIAAGYQMSLAKDGSKKNESLVANVAIYQIPEFSDHEQFLSHIAQGRAAEPSIGRFEVQKNEESLSPLNGATCVKYHSISRDKSAQIQGGGTAEMLLENLGYHCIHPKNSTVGVNMAYSLRHYPDTNYPMLNENAREFFNNVKFTEF